MTALSANKHRIGLKAVQHSIKDKIVAADSDEYYEGQILCHNGSGKVAAGANTSGFTVAGISRERLTTGASNTEEIEFEWGHIEEFPINSTDITAADVGTNAYVLDDATVTGLAGGTNRVALGRIVGFRTGFASVHVGVFADEDTTA